MKNKSNILYIIAFLFIFISCTTTTPNPTPTPTFTETKPNPNINYDYPNIGMANNSVLAIKDYQPIEIIFVKSSETIDGIGNYSGSKITYEMLMREAKKLGAHDVINIKIDVNQEQKLIYKNGYNITQTTYNYTASALAIKYTTAIQVGNNLNSYQDIGNEMIRRNNERIISRLSSNNSISTTSTFPSTFIGTWKRDNFDNTLTFTNNSIKSSSTTVSANLIDISDDAYIFNYSNSDRTFTITIKFVNNNIEISGGTGSGQGNWNGIWKKQ